MKENFDESSLNEQAINDVETARLALRWALDKIRTLHEDDLKTRQNLQEKSSQVSFLENQLKTRNSEIERASRVHEEELKSRQESLEYQFRSRLERLTDREKELEDKISKSEEVLKQKESHLESDYQKKSEELRSRWAQVEGELWQLRQEQLAKQQEFERVYGARLEEERKKFGEEAAIQRSSLEETYRNRVEELERRERATAEELRKQEAVLKWAKDSWQKETEERERLLKQKDLEIDKKVLEKNQEIDDYKVKVSLLEKQLKDLPEAARRRDEDLGRYKDAIGSLESVIRTLETEKKNLQADYEGRLAKAGEAVDSERNRVRELEVEIPKRLKIAVEHERNRFAEKLQEIESGYREDLGKKRDEIEYLQRNLRTFEETIKTLQAEREAFSHKVEQLQTQYNVRQEEVSFREKQLESEYDVRLKVEIEKKTAALRSELETSGRIYEDSLRLKVEEISHLRRDIEELSREKNAARDQQAEARRQLESLVARAAADQDALRARLTSEAERKLADEAVRAEQRRVADKEKAVAEMESRAAEFKAELARKDEEMGALRLALQRAGEEQRLAAQKAAEELRTAVAAEKARAEAEAEERLLRLNNTLKLRDDNIRELAGALEAARLEREELVLMERERLQRVYSEKEKAMDEELAARDAELLRARDAAVRAASDRDAAIARAAADLETALSAQAAEKRGLEEKLSSFAQRLSGQEAAAASREETALRREADRYNEIIERKNAELDAAARLRQSEEDAYRKTLAEFRSSLSDSLGKMENLKSVADERQAQLLALQAELAQEKKQAAAQLLALGSRASDKEKLYRDLSLQHDDLKATFEEEVKGAERRYNDVMIRLRAAEEQKAARDKQLDSLKHDLELLRAENLRREYESAEVKSAAVKQVEAERRELHAAGERRAQDYAQKEKALLNEVSALRDMLNARDVELEKYKVHADEGRSGVERLKAILAEERALKDEYDSRLAALAEREKALGAELAQLKKSLSSSAGDALEYRGEAENLRSSLERLKAGYEEERRKRVEAEAVSDAAGAALAAKAEDLSNRLSEVEALKHAVERLKRAFEDERSKRVESELLAETAHSALREKQDEFARTQKLVEQLKDKLRLWKSR